MRGYQCVTSRAFWVLRITLANNDCVYGRSKQYYETALNNMYTVLSTLKQNWNIYLDHTATNREMV